MIDSFDDLSRSYQLPDAAKTLAEIGAVELALEEYAQKGAGTSDRWQAEKCALYWCELLVEHRSRDEEVDARRWVFERWSTTPNAMKLARDWRTVASATSWRCSSVLAWMSALGSARKVRSWRSASGHGWSRFAR